jgi:hypothetical protein
MRNVREYVDAIEAGQYHCATIRKVPSQQTTAGWWADLSMAAGIPTPNYYASEPLAAATLNGDRGIYHGADKSPAKMFLQSMTLQGSLAGAQGHVRLLDYLLYYPFIDLDALEAQPMDNTVTLPRYTDGDGVLPMMVAVSPMTGGGTFQFDYIDQSGNAQTSPVISCATASSNISSIITSQQNSTAGGRLFLELASGSSGVRSVTSVTPIAPNGGLVALVLVKPIADMAMREIAIPSEREWLSDRSGPPRIYDGAYLNMVMNTPATIATATIVGCAGFVWN